MSRLHLTLRHHHLHHRHHHTCTCLPTSSPLIALMRSLSNWRITHREHETPFKINSLLSPISSSRLILLFLSKFSTQGERWRRSLSMPVQASGPTAAHVPAAPYIWWPLKLLQSGIPILCYDVTTCHKGALVHILTKGGKLWLAGTRNVINLITKFSSPLHTYYLVTILYI